MAMTNEELRPLADNVTRGIYRCSKARHVVQSGELAVLNEVRKIAIVFGTLEIYGTVARDVEGRSAQEAVEFVIFSDAGILAFVAELTDRPMNRGGVDIVVPGGLRLLPPARIQTVSLGEAWAADMNIDRMEPPFTVSVEGIGDVLVNKFTSDQEKGAEGPLFAHVRNILAARR